MSFTSLPPRAQGRVAAAFYLLNIATGAGALALRGPAASAVLVLATVAYVAVTALFYRLFHPVSALGSALAAACSLLGCLLSLLATLNVARAGINPLGFFGLYCLGIGALILRSWFIPRILGLLMILAGLSWMTFFSPLLTHHLAPYSMAPGILAELSLTLWLLVVGIGNERWHGGPASAG